MPPACASPTKASNLPTTRSRDRSLWRSWQLAASCRAQYKRSSVNRIHLAPLVKFGWIYKAVAGDLPRPLGSMRNNICPCCSGKRFHRRTLEIKCPRAGTGRRGGNDGNSGHLGPHPTSGRAPNSQPWLREASKLPNRPWLGHQSRRVLKTLIRCVAILGIAEQGAEARVSGTLVADPWLPASTAFVRVPPTHQHVCSLVGWFRQPRGHTVGRCDAANVCRARLQISTASG